MPDQRTGHASPPRAGPAHRGDDVLGDRLDERAATPARGLLDPLGAAPRRRRRDAARELGRGVEPVVGQPDGVGDPALVAWRASRDRAAPRPPGRAMSLVSSQFTAPSCGCIIAWTWPEPRQVHAACPQAGPPEPEKAAKICSNGVPVKGFGDSSPGVAAHGSKLPADRNSRPTRLMLMSTAPVVRLVDIREHAPGRVEVLAAPSPTTPPGGRHLFVGTVRDHDHGKGVTGLDYSAHPTALDRAAARR